MPSKIATPVPEFAVEDLPLGRTAAMVPEFAVPTLEQNTLMMMMIMMMMMMMWHSVHRCGASGSMRACHAAGPGSIPGRDKFPG